MTAVTDAQIKQWLDHWQAGRPVDVDAILDALEAANLPDNSRKSVLANRALGECAEERDNWMEQCIAAEARADAQIAIVERIRDQYASTGGHSWTAANYILTSLREAKP